MTCTYSLTLCGILTVLGTCEMEEGVRVDTKEEEGIQGNHLIYTEQSPWHKNQQSPRPKNLHANSLIKGLYVHLPCILACTHMQLTACIQVLLGSNTNDEKPPTSFYTHAHTHTHVRLLNIYKRAHILFRKWREPPNNVCFRRCRFHAQIIFAVFSSMKSLGLITKDALRQRKTASGVKAPTPAHWT